MAYVLDSVGIKGLRKTHFEQLLWYIGLNEIQETSCYYGNKAQFLKRQEALSEWLQNIIEHIETTDAVIPKM